MQGTLPFLVISAESTEVSWADMLQAWGTVISTAIAAISIIVTVLFYLKSERNSRITQERKDAKGVSVWGAESLEGDFCGVLIKNDCPYPAENFSLKQDSNEQRLDVNILPPGIWFSEKTEDNCWKVCIPVFRDESAPSGCAIKRKDQKVALQNAISDNNGNPLHFRWQFSLNEEGKWINSNGDLAFKKGKSRDTAEATF
ncbi:hypothetical protein KIM372_14090 [Bombiscardovia nodaiensis]|uniref:Uncharacterized protein n=1 Tax=Bombiscardovia nodaiensis TaxID=2932181 RepID=A0ABM8B9C9_9BIFI|nr:hypothetical protein KIM372_14090 [Bombiscardovia nodaiensis]